MRLLGSYCLLLALLLSTLGTHAQDGRKSREQLEKERRQIEQDVRLTRKLILQTKSHQEKSLSELRLLEKQIDLGERMLNNIAQEVNALDGEIGRMGTVVNAMEQDVHRLQLSYGKVAYLTYKTNHQLSALLWLLSSESFSQVYERLKYYREFSRFRQQQIFLIRRTQGYLRERRAEMDHKRLSKAQLAAVHKQEADKLSQVKQEKAGFYRSLHTKETQYKKQLKSYKANLVAIQREIDRLIKLEIAKSSSGERSTELLNATSKLSQLFEHNRGKLPWPISSSKSVITSSFGLVEDASGGKVQNDGIYITTEPGEVVRAVFSGKVTHVRNNKVLGTVIIIQHGKYRSVYVNLKNPRVKEGDEVATLQELGTVDVNPRTGANELNFLIYNERAPTDPAQWIVHKN